MRKHFPSDIATILLSVDTMVDILTTDRHENITLEFLEMRPPLVLSIKIPCWKLIRDFLFEFLSPLINSHSDISSFWFDGFDCDLMFNSSKVKHNFDQFITLEEEMT
ncbi:hypothetical protein GQ457_06G028010 [Hibiscus cannabinus]